MKNKALLKNNWLFLIIFLQPLLDIAAYWLQGSVTTVAGYVRLLILLIVPAAILLKEKKNQDWKLLFIELCVCAAFSLVHILNGIRVGYTDPFADIQYLLRVIQTPVLASCFIYLIRVDKTAHIKKQLLNGMFAAMVVYIAALLLSLITGSWNSTYGGTIGISGWVIDSNRCANSIILVTFCAFLMYLSVHSDFLPVNVLPPVIVCVLLLINGTKACYVSELLFMAAFAAFELFGWFVLKYKVKLGTLFITLALLATSIFVYPYTPRARQDALEREKGDNIEGSFKTELLEMGYDIDSMTVDEMLADDFLVLQFQTYYYKMIYGGIPQLLDDYDIKRVLRGYNMITDSAKLIDTRRMKRMYARFVFEDSDNLTKMVGFEFGKIGHADVDLENDWPALFYYYGYLGFALYAAMILYFIYLAIRKLITNFKESYTELNYTLLLVYLLQLGLAQLSGAIFRRPNVSIYMTVIMALIYYQTNKNNIESKFNNDEV